MKRTVKKNLSPDGSEIKAPKPASAKISNREKPPALKSRQTDRAEKSKIESPPATAPKSRNSGSAKISLPDKAAIKKTVKNLSPAAKAGGAVLKTRKTDSARLAEPKKAAKTVEEPAAPATSLKKSATAAPAKTQKAAAKIKSPAPKKPAALADKPASEAEKTVKKPGTATPLKAPASTPKQTAAGRAAKPGPEKKPPERPAKKSTPKQAEALIQPVSKEIRAAEAKPAARAKAGKKSGFPEIPEIPAPDSKPAKKSRVAASTPAIAEPSTTARRHKKTSASDLHPAAADQAAPQSKALAKKPGKKIEIVVPPIALKSPQKARTAEKSAAAKAETKVEIVIAPVAVKPVKKKIKPIGSAVVRGRTGRYAFEVFPLDAEIQDGSAIYVISKRITDKSGRGHHKFVCIGQTESLLGDIKKHKKDKCIKQHKANVICLLREESETNRLKIETDLREAHAIVCNQK